MSISRIAASMSSTTSSIDQPLALRLFAMRRIQFDRTTKVFRKNSRSIGGRRLAGCDRRLRDHANASGSVDRIEQALFIRIDRYDGSL